MKYTLHVTFLLIIRVCLNNFSQKQIPLIFIVSACIISI